jgi:hypothetical protein
VVVGDEQLAGKQPVPTPGVILRGIPDAA